MSRRALLIGSQTGGLTGVHRDVDVLNETLRGFNFDITKIIEKDATQQGILEAYEDLIGATQPDDTVMVYYSGHGGRSANPLRDSNSDAPAWLQYIVPTDFHDGAGDEFRGLLAEELSELQRRLTDRSQNVTTIFDCCHSARMFRDPDLVPKADSSGRFPWGAVETRWREVREKAAGRLGDVNPYAVQVVACEPDQSAYELPSTSIGGTHGALTAELVSVLRRPDALQLTWREVIEVVRPAILDIVSMQRPDILGPQSNRLLFSLTERDTIGVVAIAKHNGQLSIERAALFGVGEGDVYAVIAPGGDPARPWATVSVERITGDRAQLTYTSTQPETPLPDGALAYPVEVSLGRRPVAIRPSDHPDRQMFVDAFRSSANVRVADENSTGLLATVELSDAGVSFLDAQDEPFWDAPRPAIDTTVERIDEALLKLARATHVRDLGSGTGPTALADPAAAALTLSYFRIDPVTREEIPIRPGEHLFSGDLVGMSAKNGTAEKRYLSVLDVGLTGGVSILTESSPSGVTIASGETYVLGQNAAHQLEGIELYWPDGLPAGTLPRAESFVALISDNPVNGLQALKQSGVKTRSAGARGKGHALDRLISDLAANARDARPAGGGSDSGGIRYRVERFDFLLHSTQRSGNEKEPKFEIDNRPDPTMRMIVPRTAGAVPKHVSLRLTDLTVHSNRSFLKAKVRVDFMVITTPPDGSVTPYLAKTEFFDRIKDGDRLPLDSLLIYDGPVDRFLDIAVWVSRADDKQVGLADLLAEKAGNAEVVGAVATLASLAVAAPPAAVVAGSVAAVATLVSHAARVVEYVAGKTIGVYRTTWLPHERFGAGEPALRHPAEGTIKAQDMSFAYEVIDAR